MLDFSPTGAVRGDLCPEDCDLLWEDLVLEQLISDPAVPEVRCWRNNNRREVGLLVPGAHRSTAAIECPWSASGFDPKHLAEFPELHPVGENLGV
jgi:hypothetical protein